MKNAYIKTTHILNPEQVIWEFPVHPFFSTILERKITIVQSWTQIENLLDKIGRPK